ncbi:hypothetical protein I4F81_011208 [Pyropia yezoensis]|uniref:Uncharacterized protein n=1 Tax=Pyropia yezoensis TaxID=2788 RepID=A0ACC3CES0_PYRYE|nr:hypothetical protein I4F81_011208 [Neopyropia yezoensis]
MGRGEGVPVSLDERASVAMPVDDMDEKARAKKERKEKKSAAKASKEGSAKKVKSDKKRKHSADDASTDDAATTDTPAAPSPVAKRPKADTPAPSEVRAIAVGDGKIVFGDADEEDRQLASVTKTAIPEAEDLALSKYALSAPTVKALASKGIKALFPIQAATFDLLFHKKRDIIGRARTGSGKTLAFVLPIVEALAASQKAGKLPGREGKPLVLVLAPTRELAQQVERDFAWIGNAHGLKSACFYGGSAMGPQLSALRMGRGLDILVGTPGRLLDHLERGTLNLSGVRYVALDEADEMLSMGFSEDVEKLLAACTADVKQTLLFSATIPRWVKDLASKYLRSDQTETVDMVSDDKNRTNTDITHLMLSCPPGSRLGVLADVIRMYAGPTGKCLIFTDTKAEATDLGSTPSITAALGTIGTLHGDIPQATREQTIAAFRSGKIRVLVATDVAARGLDVPNVELVVQTHPPTSYETYIHRSGRTGRAGKTGTAITFFSLREKSSIGLITHKAGIKFKRVSAPQTADMVAANTSDTVKKVNAVPQSTLKVFASSAAQLLREYDAPFGVSEEDKPKAALAAVLACLAGFGTQTVQVRSMLTCFEGQAAVVMKSPVPLASQQAAWVPIRRHFSHGLASGARGLTLSADHSQAVFDVAQHHMKEIEDFVPGSDGITFELASGELPALEEERFDLQSALSANSERKNAWRGRAGGFRGGGGGGGRGGGGGGFRGGGFRGGRGGGGGFRR